jgi:hypothetical protein
MRGSFDPRLFLHAIERREGLVGMGVWWLLVIIGLWVLLQVYILPKLGIST